MIPRGENIIDFITDVVNPTGGVFFKEARNWAAFTKRVEQLDFCIRKFDEHDRNAVIRFILWIANLCAQRIAVLVGRRLEVRYGNGYVIQSSDHLVSPSVLGRAYPPVHEIRQEARAH